MNPTTSSSLTVRSLILEADIVVQFVLLLLVVMSLVSIAIILMKRRQLKRTQEATRRFLDYFWEADSLESVFGSRERFSSVALSRVFNHAFREFKAFPMMNSGDLDIAALGASLDNVRRQLSTHIEVEIKHLTKYLPFLAITASSAPFIGLFGTVWGIMGSFLGIGASGSTSLAVVAPGIAEALIATAVGLFAAIPAVIFYNIFIHGVRTLRKDFEGFGAELINVIVKARLRRPTGGGSEPIRYEISV